MIKLSELILNEGPIEYPADHQPGMQVTKGGSMCANCKFWVAKGNKPIKIIENPSGNRTLIFRLPENFEAEKAQKAGVTAEENMVNEENN